MQTGKFVPSWQIRAQLCQYLSNKYAEEVPLYKTLTQMVQDVNREVIVSQPELGLNVSDVEVISAERHGAIRLAKPQEMKTMARIFRVMAMFPVDFYDLTKAGNKRQPVISTAFRPVDLEEIEKSSFRMFVSLLQPDDRSFFSEELGNAIKENTASRQIFSEEIFPLLEKHEQQGGLNSEDVEKFVVEVAKTFRWSGKAKNRKLYNELVAGKLLIAADIACFPNPHLNHLTPNSLDIKRLYNFMKERLGDNMKDSIEGPPERKIRILLRQTSYKALVEKLVFVDENNKEFMHKARFGEIEERGAAMTRKGRALYNKALDAYMENGDRSSFSVIPDDHQQLSEQQLLIYLYSPTGKAASSSLSHDLEDLLAKGYIKRTPLRYEDFLPVSAAGIFASNLDNYGVEQVSQQGKQYSKESLESIIEHKILEPFAIYEGQSARSIIQSYQHLNIWEKVPSAQQQKLTQAVNAMSM